MILCEPSIASSWCCGGMAGSVTPQGVRLQEKCCGGAPRWGRFRGVTPTCRGGQMGGGAGSGRKTKEVLGRDRGGGKDGLEALLKAEPGLLRFAAPNGSSVLLLTAYYGHPELAEVFSRHGAKPDVFEASALGDLETVRNVVGGDRALVNAFAADGFYPLGLAAFFGDPPVLGYFLKNGADVKNSAPKPPKGPAPHP